jgi:single-strand DNA-binding protein
MAGSVNKVILVGNVGKDPEVRTTQDGSKVANLSLATSETWNDKASGERKEKTEWHRVSILNPRIAELVEKFVKKGSKIYVEGSLQTREWTDSAGQKRFSTETLVGFTGQVIFLSSAGNGEGRPAGQSASSAPSSGAGGTGAYGTVASVRGQPKKQLVDDDIPF